MPVYAGDLDDPRGMVHIRDVLGHITRTSRTKKLSRAKPGSATAKKAAENTVLDLGKVDLTKSIGELKLLREVLFVPHSMLAGDLLQRMRATRTQMALVIDEYGGTDGLVSMEDVVEMVVGDIEDEHDDAVSSISEQSPGVYVVDGGVELDELAEAIGPDFVVGKDGEDVDTIAGLIIAVLGHHPVKGETCVAVPGFEFKVLEAGNRRVRKVRISRSSD
jgi:CBS domain containing-hemolysin-like protein